MNVVDMDSHIPKYLQISDWIQELIKTGRLKEGEKLPSEMELASQCAVNRNTLRQAISELVTKGKIRKVKGVGSFVNESVPVELKHDIKKIVSFKDYFGSENLIERTIVLSKDIVMADKETAEKLVLGKERKVVMLKRLRTGDGVPYIYEKSFLPYNIFKNIIKMDVSGSLYKLITKKFNIKLTRSKQIIRSVNLDAKVATMFNLPEGTAGFHMKNVTYDRNNTPVEVLSSYCRGDKYIFELELGEYELNRT